MKRRIRKRRTLDSLIELTYTGNADDWREARRVVAEAQGAALIQEALRSVREVIGARFVVEPMPWSERVFELVEPKLPFRLIE